MTTISMASTLSPMRGWMQAFTRALMHALTPAFMHAQMPWSLRGVERLADAVGAASADEATAYQLPLRHGRLRSFTRPHGLSMHCVRGTLWITVDGEAADHVLAAGASFEPTSARRVLVYALEDAVLRVQPAAPAWPDHRQAANLHMTPTATRPRLVVQADPH